MTQKDLADYVRFKTKTDSTTFSDANMLMIANIEKDEIAKRIIKVNEDYFGTPALASLVANQREYAFPLDILSQIKYVEAKLDGTNWLHLSELDIVSYGRTTDESTITSYFQNLEGEAFYDIFRGSLWIYSGTITSVSNGLKLWYMSWPADFTDLSEDTRDISQAPTTTSHGFPKQFHKLLAKKTIIEWKESQDTPVQLTQSEMNWEQEMQETLDSIKNQNLDRVVTGALPDPMYRGNNGADY